MGENEKTLFFYSSAAFSTLTLGLLFSNDGGQDV